MKYTAEEVRARINKAWQNHDEQGRVFITMEDAMALVETILPERIKADEGEVPVAEVCSLFELRWAGADSISSIADRNGIKVGDKLYAAPPIDLAAVRKSVDQLREACRTSNDSAYGTLSTSFVGTYLDDIEAAIKGVA